MKKILLLAIVLFFLCFGHMKGLLYAQPIITARTVYSDEAFTLATVEVGEITGPLDISYASAVAKATRGEYTAAAVSFTCEFAILPNPGAPIVSPVLIPVTIDYHLAATISGTTETDGTYLAPTWSCAGGRE